MAEMTKVPFDVWCVDSKCRECESFEPMITRRKEVACSKLGICLNAVSIREKDNGTESNCPCDTCQVKVSDGYGCIQDGCSEYLKWKEGEEDASCENCEHAYRGADPLKILQDSGNVFCCSAGFKYGGADTVCTEWKRKEGEMNDLQA